MFRRYFLVCLGLFLSLLLTAQCPTGDVVLFTQAGIDAFAADFSDCTDLQGDLQLGAPQTFSNIRDLTALSQINSIAGSLLVINNDELQSLAGLDQISEIQGSLQVSFNDTLMDVQVLRSLTTLVGDLEINFNLNLQNIDTLELLSTIGGEVSIGGNPQLQHLFGFERLEAIGGTLDIFANNELTSLAGFNNLAQIGGGLFLSENERLVDISALSNIQTLGGNLAFAENPELQHLDALSELERINGRLTLFGNTSLQDIDGLRNILPQTISDLDIRFNSSLSNCAIRSICQYLQLEGAPAIIENNAIGCSSREEVETTCPLQGNLCVDAINANGLLGRAINQPQFSSLLDNSEYTATDNPANGFDCFFSTGEIITNSIWFRFTGDGNDYRITTAVCNATNYIDLGETQMALYQGDCDNLIPVDCNENADNDIPLLNGQITISTEVGVDYFLLVDGTISDVSDGTGEFCLEVTRLMITDVVNNQPTEISLYPNPTTGHLFITGIEVEEAILYNMSGWQVSKTLLTGNTLDISMLPAGMYYLHLSSADRHYQTRVVKTN